MLAPAPACAEEEAAQREAELVEAVMLHGFELAGEEGGNWARKGGQGCMPGAGRPALSAK